MRYDQGREQSKKILKQAVSYMGRQHASFDPASYTLWYEHAAGLNPALSQVLDERLTSQRPLTDADVSRLYTQYVASRELQAIEQIQARLVAHLQDISRELSDTGTHAAQFGLQLEHHGEQLKATSSIDSIESIVGELLGETHKMVAMHRTMARHLETRASDVQSLTTRLQQAEADALGDPLTGLLNRRGFEQAVRDGASPSGSSKAPRCCWWMWMSSRTSMTLMDTRREIKCCVGWRKFCAPGSKARTSRPAWVEMNSPCYYPTRR